MTFWSHCTERRLTGVDLDRYLGHETRSDMNLDHRRQQPGHTFLAPSHCPLTRMFLPYCIHAVERRVSNATTVLSTLGPSKINQSILAITFPKVRITWQSLVIRSHQGWQNGSRLNGGHNIVLLGLSDLMDVRAIRVTLMIMP